MITPFREIQVMGRGTLDVLHARNVSQTGIGIYVPHDFAGCDLEATVELIITLPHERPFLTHGTIKHQTEHAKDDIISACTSATCRRISSRNSGTTFGRSRGPRTLDMDQARDPTSQIPKLFHESIAATTLYPRQPALLPRCAPCRPCFDGGLCACPA